MIESSESYREAVIADGRRTYVKAVVDIIDPDMEKGEIKGTDQDMDVSRIGQLWDKQFEDTSNYATLEPGRWVLDGGTQLLPDAQPSWEIGMVGLELSGPDGTFPTGQWAELHFSNVSILQACAVAFSDNPRDGAAEEFKVEVLSEGVAYYTGTVTGNRDPLVSLGGFRVMNPDTLRVTVTKWSLPGRRARFLELVPGVYEVWTGDELAEVSVKHQGDVSCLTIPYGTATIQMDNLDRRFEPRNKKGVFLSIEERQGIELYMGVELPGGKVEYKGLGVFYQSGDGWKTGENNVTMRWELVDIIGMIARRTFIAPKTLPTTLEGWLSALTGQLGKNFENRYYVSPEYAKKTVTIYRNELNGMTCGDVLRYVCMATGTWPHADAATGRLAAEPVGSKGNRVTLENLNKYPAMSPNRDVAYVEVNGYQHYGNNMAAGDTITVKNPFVGPMSSMEMTRNILRVSCGGNQIELLGRGDPASEVGDVDAVWLDDGNAVTARRIRQELSISNGVLKDCKSVLIRPDGMFAFTNRVQLLEPGTFTVPPDVYQLRVILVGQGSAGSPGSDGDWRGLSGRKPAGWEEVGGEIGDGTGGYAPWKGGTPLIGKNGEEIIEDREIVAGGGIRGSMGRPGKVWEGVIVVNPGQVFQVTFGKETEFGPYSSANGSENGLRDIATGELYGSNSYPPKPGSGNGGIGGAPGESGRYHGVGNFELGEWYVADSYPTQGESGTEGSSGSAIIYWETPEVIEE